MMDKKKKLEYLAKTALFNTQSKNRKHKFVGHMKKITK
jgi:hypothetical protein